MSKKKKTTIKPEIDITKLPTGHRPHKSGAGPHTNKKDKRSKDKLRKEIEKDLE